MRAPPVHQGLLRPLLMPTESRHTEGGSGHPQLLRGLGTGIRPPHTSRMMRKHPNVSRAGILNQPLTTPGNTWRGCQMGKPPPAPCVVRKGHLWPAGGASHSSFWSFSSIVQLKTRITHLTGEIRTATAPGLPESLTSVISFRCQPGFIQGAVLSIPL